MRAAHSCMAPLLDVGLGRCGRFNLYDTASSAPDSSITKRRNPNQPHRTTHDNTHSKHDIQRTTYNQRRTSLHSPMLLHPVSSRSLSSSTRLTSPLPLPTLPPPNSSSPPSPPSDCVKPPTIEPIELPQIHGPYASMGERVPPPTIPKPPSMAHSSGGDDVVYCRWPDLRHRHYIVGSDGSLFNEATRRWVRGTRLPEVGLFVVPVKPLSGRGTKIPRARIVLIAHGHTPPLPNSILHHRDGDLANDALSNLVWREPTDFRAYPELVAESRHAESRGSPIEFRWLPSYSNYLVCSDGRIWSTHIDRWTTRPQTKLKHDEEDELETPSKQARSLKDAPLPRWVHFNIGDRDVKRLRSHFVWEAFYGRPPIIGSIILHIDGNPHNNHLHNLFESLTSRHELLLEAPSSDPPILYRGVRPSPVPKDEPTIPQPDPDRIFHGMGDAAVPGVVYAYLDAPEFQPYVIGSDGTVRIPLKKLRLLKASMMSASGEPERNDSRLTVRLYSESGEVHAHHAVGDIVLTAHGHPRPHPRAILRYRDGDPRNCRIDNLYWESTDDVMRHEVAVAASRGESLSYAEHSEFPGMRVTSDGRFWSVHFHTWCSPSHRTNLRSNITGRLRAIDTSRFLWEAFHRQQVAPHQRIWHVDGNRQNRSLDNLIVTDRFRTRHSMHEKMLDNNPTPKRTPHTTKKKKRETLPTNPDAERPPDA